jgi:small nuclear ribonucleoprotein G
VTGILRGYDQFMNLVLDNTFELQLKEKKEIGLCVIRGNSIELVECLEYIPTKY